MRRDGSVVFELELRMYARSRHHMKRTGEFVLMNRRRAIHPKKQLDVKTRVLVNNDLRLAESRLRLRRL